MRWLRAAGFSLWFWFAVAVHMRCSHSWLFCFSSFWSLQPRQQAGDNKERGAERPKGRQLAPGSGQGKQLCLCV